MSHEFVDRMMEQSKSGDLRSPVSETLDMHLVEFGRGEATMRWTPGPSSATPWG